LEQLAAINALPDLTDPVAWEREIRQDRPLPDREGAEQCNDGIQRDCFQP
jgi:hypothetical protein